MVYLFGNQFFHGIHHNYYVYATFNLRGYNFCVYEGIDTLTLAGLDFIFPLYLFIIIIILTLIARCRGPYSKNRFQFSTTKVFATLLYLCYSLLVDSSFQMLTVTVIETPSGKEARWRVDPSIKYFSGAHGFLGALSILCLLMLLFVALLLLFPKQAYRFRIIQKLKPLIDAFQAPFKLKYSFWIGLRLVLRICLHIMANAIPEKYVLYVVGCIFCLLLYTQTVCAPYKENMVNALDNFFIVLLIMQFIEALSETEVPVIAIGCVYLFLIIYFISLGHRIIHRFSRLKQLLMMAQKKLLSLVNKSHKKGYTEINSFAEDKEINSFSESNVSATTQEPFERSVRTDYAGVPTTTIPDIPQAMNYTRFRESMLEVIDDGN